MWIVFLIGLILGEAVAGVFVKQHSITKTPATFLFAMAFYIIANVSWLTSMRYRSNLTIGANIFSIGGGLLAAFIGIYFYGEVISTQQIIGIVLGVLSLCLLVL